MTAARTTQTLAQPPSWRSSGAIVLVSLLLLMVSLPFLDDIRDGDVVESALMTLVLCTGVATVVRSRAAFVCSLGLCLVAVAARWLHHANPGAAVKVVYLVASTLAMGCITWQFLSTVLRARRVDAHVLCLGVAAFLLLALVWATLYVLVDSATPGSFGFSYGEGPQREMRGFVALYFSLVTLCTVGFGDIAPISDAARMLAMLEGAAGVFYIAIMLSRLVSLYASDKGDDAR